MWRRRFSKDDASNEDNVREGKCDDMGNESNEFVDG